MFPDIPVSTREEARQSRSHPEEPRFRLLAREEGSFPCVVGKEFPAFRSTLKRRHSLQERREELQGGATITRVPQRSQSIPGKTASLHCLDFQAEDRLTPRWQLGVPCRKASRESLGESLEGKPQIPWSTGKVGIHCCYSSGGKRTCMPPLVTRTDSTGETPEVPQDPCQHWRGMLRFWHRLYTRS